MNRKRLYRGVSASALAMLLTLGILLSGFAQTNDWFELEALGVIDGLPQAELDEFMSREAFSRVAVNISSYDRASGTTAETLPFYDAVQSPYAEDIATLYALRLVSGSAGGTFEPERPITYSEACKIIVNILGYGAVMESRSLKDYRVEAASLGVFLAGASADSQLTYGQVYALIDRALDVHILEFDFNSRYTVSSMTLRDFLAGGNSDTTLVHMRGVVTADSSTYLYDMNEGMRQDQLEIEGKVYDYDGIAPLGCVGQEMEFFVRSDSDGRDVIFSIRPWRDTLTAEFSGRQVKESGKDTLSYYPDLNKNSVKRFRLTDSTVILYNNRVDKFDLSDLANMDFAQIKVVDNGSDGSADVIFITEYAYCVVEKIYPESKKVYLDSETLLSGERTVELDTESQDRYVAIWDADGNEMRFEQIETDDLLCIAQSSDKNVLDVHVSKEGGDGTLRQIVKEQISIGETVYELSAPITNVEPGNQVKFWLDTTGRVAAVKSVRQKEGYAYVYASAKKALDEYVVRLLIPGAVSVKVLEKEDEDGGTATKTPKLFCTNKAIEDYTLAYKVNVDGANMSAEKAVMAVMNKPVTFKLDDQGKIKRFDFLELISDDPTKVYNGHELTFGKSAGTAFGISQDATSSVCIPTNSDAGLQDLQTSIELINGVSYSVKGYELDPATQLAGLLLVSAEMRGGIPGVISASSDVAMVKEVVNVFEDGQIVCRVTLMTDGETVTYGVSDAMDSSGSSLELKQGDLIAYSLDDKDKLDNYKLLQGADDDINFWLDLYSSWERYCGQVRNIRYHYVSSLKGRWVNNIEVGPYGESGIDTTYELYERTAIPIYILNRYGEPEFGSFEDLTAGDRVFVSLNLGIPRALVIYK